MAAFYVGQTDYITQLNILESRIILLPAFITGAYLYSDGSTTSWKDPLNAPTLVTPVLGVATATSINKLTITAPATSAVLTIADGKTLTASNSLTLTGTDASSVAFGSGGTVVYTSNKLSIHASTTSAELAGIISDETGSGVLVFGTSPAITTSLTTPSTSFALLNTTATTVNAFGAATTVSIGASSGTTTINNDLTISGNFIVNGTTTTINATTVSVDDINITLGDTASPTDVSAVGGGITLKGATDKSIAWSAANGWTSSETFNIASGKTYKIAGTDVLSSTTLGSGVTGSSLTSVATIGTGTWQGTVIAGQYGGSGVANTGKTITLGGNLTTSGAFATTFTATAATSLTLPTSGTLATTTDTHYIGTTGVALNRSSANLALTGILSVTLPGSTSGSIQIIPTAVAGTSTVLTLPAVTGIVVTTGDTGTVTNTMLAGSIANAKLTNSSTTIGTTAIALGASSTTLAGLTSVTSTGFTGALTGNADTATTLATSRTIALTGDATASGSFNGSANYSQALTLATVNTNVGQFGSTTAIPVVTVNAKGLVTAISTVAISGSLTFTGDVTGTGSTGGSTALSISAGAVTNAMLAGSIANAKLTNSSTTIGTTAIALGASSTTLAGLTSVTSTGFTGALTGNASTATTLATPRAIQGVNFDGSAAITVITAGTGISVTGTSVAIGQAVGTSSNVTFNDLTVSGNLTVSGTTTTINTATLDVADLNITVAKNAATAAAANGAGLTVNGPATPATLTYTSADDRWNFNKTLNATLVGNVTGNITGNITGNVNGNVTGTVSGNAGTVTNGVYTTDTGTVTNTMLAGSIANAKLTNSNTTIGTTAIALGASSTTLGGLTSVTSTGFTGALTGNASTVTNGVYTTDTGTVTSTMIANDTIVNADINSAAAIVDTKLATISTAGKVSNSATTATNLNTASAIVARDASGNFTAGTITAALTGNVTGNTTGTHTGAVVGNASTVTNGVYTTDTGTVTSTMIADGTIVNGDISASAAIAYSKLALTGAILNADLAGSIANTKLANSSTTIGTTAIALGASSTTLAGMTSITYSGSTSGTAQIIPAAVAGTGTVLTLPAVTGTLATLAGTETLTNKTIVAASNTISGLTNSNFSGTAGITNANLANSSVTVTAGTGMSGGGAVSLGGTVTLTNAGVLSVNGSTGTITGIATTAGTLAQFAATTSAQLAGVISDETGSGALVFATSPTLVTPVLGIASATSVNKVTITAPATGSTLTIAEGKTLTASNSLTLTGTDLSSIAFGSGGTVAYTSNKLSAFSATTSAELAGVLSDETGYSTGALAVFSKSPSIDAPTITGHATIESITATGATGTGNLVFSISPTFTGTPLSTTAGAGTNTTQIATTAFVQTAVSNLVASAPATLDTLNELATALGNDANFSTTISTSIGLKAPIASPTFTGTVTVPTLNLTNALAVAYGGTGLTTAPTNGQIDIGSTGVGFVRTTITAGSGITVTNAAGSITITSTSGGGSVTSVAQTFTGGLISVAGSPITSAGTLALTVAGTSGGIPYFSSASTWASSAALTQYGIIYGGGAGAAPVATAAGTTGQVLTATTGSAPGWSSLPSGSISVTGGDLTLSGNTGTAITNATLATVNSNIGTFNNVTVNAKGLVTAASNASYALSTDIVPLKKQEFTAIATQTTFTITGGYSVGTVQVFANGIALAAADFTAANGTTVVLTEARVAGDNIIISSGGVFQSSGTTTNALTFSTGLVLDSGTTFNGSAARTVSLATSGASSGTYGDNYSGGSYIYMPQFTVDTYGRITAVSTNYISVGGGTSLPSQTGNSGKYLTTNGTTLSWATVATAATSGLTWTYGAYATSSMTLTAPAGVTTSGNQLWVVIIGLSLSSAQITNVTCNGYSMTLSSSGGPDNSNSSGMLLYRINTGSSLSTSVSISVSGFAGYPMATCWVTTGNTSNTTSAIISSNSSSSNPVSYNPSYMKGPTRVIYYSSSSSLDLTSNAGLGAPPSGWTAEGTAKHTSLSSQTAAVLKAPDMFSSSATFTVTNPSFITYGYAIAYNN